MGESGPSAAAPDTLIHFIDGFIFEESDKPFPVSNLGHSVSNASSNHQRFSLNRTLSHRFWKMSIDLGKFLVSACHQQHLELPLLHYDCHDLHQNSS